MSKLKTTSGSYPWGRPELVSILNEVFMDGGRAYNPWKGFRRRFSGILSATASREWELSMQKAIAAIEALPSNNGIGGSEAPLPSKEGKDGRL